MKIFCHSPFQTVSQLLISYLMIFSPLLYGQITKDQGQKQPSIQCAFKSNCYIWQFRQIHADQWPIICKVKKGFFLEGGLIHLIVIEKMPRANTNHHLFICSLGGIKCFLCFLRKFQNVFWILYHIQLLWSLQYVN